MTIDIVQLASIITSLSVIIGAILGGYKIFQKRNQSDEKHEQEIQKLNTKVKNVQKEQTLICYGLEATLDGLEQLGANHNVSIAREMLSKHLNKAAHEQE